MTSLLAVRSVPPLCRQSSSNLTTLAAVSPTTVSRAILSRPYSALQSGGSRAVAELSSAPRGCCRRALHTMGPVPFRPPSSSSTCRTTQPPASIVARTTRSRGSAASVAARTRQRRFGSSSSSSSSAAPTRRSKSTAISGLGAAPARAGAGAAAGRGGVSAASTTIGGAGWRTVLRSFRDSLNTSLLKPRTLPIPRWIAPKLYTLTFSEVFGHSSFLLVAVSYATDDFLMLRVIAVAGSTAMLFFTYFHPHGRILWLPLKWNVLFIAINSYRIGSVLYQQYLTDRMPDEMRKIREDHFYVVDPIDFGKLVMSGTEETFQSGDLIVQQGSMNRYIRLVIDGEVEVLRDGEVTYTIEEGNFIAEAGLHAGIMLRGAVESCAGIIAAQPNNNGADDDGKPRTVRCLRWDRTELMDLLEQEKGLRRSLKAALSWDIIRKLKAQRYMLASGEVDDPEMWTIKRNAQNDNRYAAILSNMLQHPDYLANHKDQLTKYRAIHHIDDEHHRIALEKCGWTPEEFKLGHRSGLVDEEEETIEEEEFERYDWKSKAKLKARKASSVVASILG